MLRHSFSVVLTLLFKLHLLSGSSKLHCSHTVLTVITTSERQSIDILVASYFLNAHDSNQYKKL